jgi:hypothetical protein
VTPLANPTATAHEVARLLLDPDYWERASRAARERVRLFYDMPSLDRSYRELYEYWRGVPDCTPAEPVSGTSASSVSPAREGGVSVQSGKDAA